MIEEENESLMMIKMIRAWTESIDDNLRWKFSFTLS